MQLNLFQPCFFDFSAVQHFSSKLRIGKLIQICGTGSFEGVFE